MKNCTLLDFKQLMDEILNSFLDHAGRYLRENELLADADIKDEFEDSERQLLIELMAEHSQMQFLSGMYSVQDLLNLLDQISTVIAELGDYRQQKINQQYSEILNKYIELVIDKSGKVYTYNPSLKRRINGILNIRKRYVPLLNKKLEIFYSELIGYVQKNGRFKNTSQAVQLILPTLQIKFREFDLRWVQSKVNENQQKILDLTEAREKNKKKESDEDSGTFLKIQDRTYSNQIRKLQNENKKWQQFLQHPDRYFPQHKQLPFNTVYCDEVLVNHLRRCPDLLKEIIQVPS
ncbi:hypothetical protein [Acinetobacter johnsonii]|uniref:hypothetical protein n=1 Tax=Acinetobacter johnsonii TaxID=40214 RepID=UPI00125029E4|nr:hypothetical protein [Acinetobacter johnsonii]